MAVIRFKNKPAFNNFIASGFTTMPSIMRDEFQVEAFKGEVLVNVLENDNGIILEVIAPGLKKEWFSVHIEKNLLTVSAEKKVEANREETLKTMRSEYQAKNFTRSFSIPEDVDAEQISAQYVNGVLRLNLPRKAEVKQASKQISIN